MPRAFKISGKAAPLMAATNKLIIIAAPNDAGNNGVVKPEQRNQGNHCGPKHAINAGHNQFPLNNQRKLAPLKWPSAWPRITSVNTWLPAMPPILATIGISTASATTCSMVLSNKPITAEAIKAVIKFMPNHNARRLLVFNAGAKVSSSFV